jgi:hypothetical protein
MCGLYVRDYASEVAWNTIEYATSATANIKHSDKLQ